MIGSITEAPDTKNIKRHSGSMNFAARAAAMAPTGKALITKDMALARCLGGQVSTI
ncbi:hypothetical protein D9M71_419100 [compost metagenome]